jgi:hypothetical protein
MYNPFTTPTKQHFPNFNTVFSKPNSASNSNQQSPNFFSTSFLMSPNKIEFEQYITNISCIENEVSFDNCITQQQSQQYFNTIHDTVMKMVHYCFLNIVNHIIVYKIKNQ